MPPNSPWDIGLPASDMAWVKQSSEIFLDILRPALLCGGKISLYGGQNSSRQLKVPTVFHVSIMIPKWAASNFSGLRHVLPCA